MIRPALRSAQIAWPADPRVVWHDAECGAYAADLDLWLELANRGPRKLLDIGCGSGRVALPLARAGHSVVGFDLETALLAALERRARHEGMTVETVRGDIRHGVGAAGVELAIAPMQLIQLLGGVEGRARFFASASELLAPGGMLAVAISATEDLGATIPESADFAPPAPDRLEIDGWQFSSHPQPAYYAADGRLTYRRLRSAVSPSGAVDESIETVFLDGVTAATIWQEALPHGFRPARELEPIREIPATDGYVDSTVLTLERAGSGKR